MKYLSTRDTNHVVDFETALFDGMAPNNGLYVPSIWPKLEQAHQKKLRGRPYNHIAGAVINHFTSESLSEEVLAHLVLKSYHNDIFCHRAVAPLIQVRENLWIMELFHGPTLAFKDYALQFLGHLFDHFLKQQGRRITIVGATSGDTGSAAIHACKMSEYIDIFILHPQGRTSEVQRKQMTTVQADNVHNIAIDGTFDDCQNLVKAMFADQAFSKSCSLSAINSINWARITAQISYYVSAALSLGAPDVSVNFAVPTGNFGNVFAAHCARNMGLPINKLIIGTNQNDIVARFFQSGMMTASKVIPTLSPSMDIQISSNFERYLFELLGGSSVTLKDQMENFKAKGELGVDSHLLKEAQNAFSAHRCSEEETLNTMRQIYAESGYVLDPHTAVGVHAALQEEHEAGIPTVALACAHPAKFPEAVERAIDQPPEVPEMLRAVMDKAEFMTALPNDLEKVQDFIQEQRTK